MAARWSNHLAAAVLVVALVGMPLAARAKEPTSIGDAAVLDRTAKPRVIVNTTRVEVNGKAILLDKTRAEEIAELTGHAAYSQASADTCWNATGVVIHAAEDRDTPGRPKIVHRIAVWFRQDVDSSVRNPCTPAERKQHQESVQMRLESIEREEKAHNLPRDEEARRRLSQEECSPGAQAREPLPWVSRGRRHAR